MIEKWIVLRIKLCVISPKGTVINRYCSFILCLQICGSRDVICDSYAYTSSLQIRDRGLWLWQNVVPLLESCWYGEVRKRSSRSSWLLLWYSESGIVSDHVNLINSQKKRSIGKLRIDTILPIVLPGISRPCSFLLHHQWHMTRASCNSLRTEIESISISVSE